MKPVVSMVAASAASWAGVAVVFERRTSIEVLFGMLGPLAAVSGTWFLAEYIYLQHSQELTSLMVSAFVLKMAFFGGYVALMIGVLRLRPVQFVAGFTSYFIALYLMEALYLRRLFSTRSQ